MADRVKGEHIQWSLNPCFWSCKIAVLPLWCPMKMIIENAVISNLYFYCTFIPSFSEALLHMIGISRAPYGTGFCQQLHEEYWHFPTRVQPNPRLFCKCDCESVECVCCSSLNSFPSWGLMLDSNCRHNIVTISQHFHWGICPPSLDEVRPGTGTESPFITLREKLQGKSWFNRVELKIPLLFFM